MTVRRAKAVTVAKRNEKIKSKQNTVKGRAAALPFVFLSGYSLIKL